MLRFLNFYLKQLSRIFQKSTSSKKIETEKVLIGKTYFKALSNILIIDDDASCLSTLELLLKSESYNVSKVDNGSIALQYLANNSNAVDLILLDLMMPGINGFDILDSLEKNVFLKDIPIIIQSGIIDDEIRLKISNNAVKGFIAKPYKKQELIRTIDEIFC